MTVGRVLGGLKAGPSWFISDHLLLMDSRTGNAEDVAHQVADAARTCDECDRPAPARSFKRKLRT